MAAAAAALSSLAPELAAQFGPPPKPVTVIQGGTVHVGNGDVIEGGRVVVRGSRIEAVGKDVAVPEGATVVDASGRHVYPGLIDAESALLIDPSGRTAGEGNVVVSVVDALDPFASEAIEDALRAGVTTIGVSTRRGLLDGTGAALKVAPGGRGGDRTDLILRRDLWLTATLGLNGERPSTRLRDWKSFAEQLQATKKYVEAWDDYAEKLEEYKKELEKAKKEAEQRKAEGKPEPAPAPEPPKAEPAPERREEGGPPRRPGPRRRPGGALIDLLSGGGEDDEPAHAADGDSFAEGPPPGPPQQGPSQGGQGAEKKEEGPKKPPRPNREPHREVLRQVLAGKLPLNVYADLTADLTNLLELARQHRFRFVVTGAREAGHVARELAAAGESLLAVVVVQPHDLESEHLATAAELDAAGVNVVLTTAGRTGGATRHLSLAAAAAVAGGMEPERALAAITSRAAALLGVADRVGTLEAGKDADVVITRGELFSSTAVVERVLAGGATVVAR